MKGLTLSQREERRLQVLNQVLEGQLWVKEAAGRGILKGCVKRGGGRLSFLSEEGKGRRPPLPIHRHLRLGEAWHQRRVGDAADGRGHGVPGPAQVRASPGCGREPWVSERLWQEEALDLAVRHRSCR